MRKSCFVILAVAFLAWTAAAQTSASTQTSSSTSAQTSTSANDKSVQTQTSGQTSTSTQASGSAGPAAVELSDGTMVTATLDNSLDAKKNKPGDPVVARTTEPVKHNGKVILPKKTKLLGHVTQAQAKGEGHAESALGIAFDQAVLKNGQQMPVNFAIQAIASGQSAANAALGNDDTSGSLAGGGSAMGGGHAAGGGLLGTAGSAVGGTTQAVGGVTSGVGQTAGATAGAATRTAAGTTGGVGRTIGATGQLTSSSTGIIGLQGLNLTSAASNSTQGSLVTSTSRNVHLDSGTEMLLRASGSGQQSSQNKPGMQGHGSSAPPQPQPEKPPARKP